MWTTPEVIKAEIDYRKNGTMDLTSRLHLMEVRRAAPRWWNRLTHREQHYEGRLAS